MNTLYFEVIGSVVLAGVLGLFTGWMAHRAKARRTMRRTVSYWQRRCEELLPGDGEDAESLRDQVSSLDQLLGVEMARTRELETQLGATNSRLEKARGDTIRLNSQQAGIQERLQRIIREKDQELRDLAKRVGRSGESGDAGGANEPAKKQAAPAAVASDEIEAYIDRLSDRGERTHPGTQRSILAGAGAAPIDTSPTTIADSPEMPDTATDQAPTVVEPAAPEQGPASAREARLLDEDDIDDHLDDTLDATAVIDMEMEHDVTATRRIEAMDDTGQEPELYDEETLAFEEDTIAFDDATLARVRERS